MGSRTGYADGTERAAEPAGPKSVLRDYAETILICVIFVIFTRGFVFQQSKIPSGSMEDTLLIGDYILVNRFIYAPTASDWERRILPVRDIRRGDVIVFKNPDTPEVDFIKRVIGIPGDTIELFRGRLVRNGEPVEEPYVNPDYFPGPYEEDYWYPKQTVEPGHVFVMGDHRNRSSDSRRWGQLPQAYVKGRAVLIWWSFPEKAGDINLRGTDRLKAIGYKALHFVTRSRWSRCFTLIR